jgi:cytochrome b6-f complex iron-sulfur subunit
MTALFQIFKYWEFSPLLNRWIIILIKNKTNEDSIMSYTRREFLQSTFVSVGTISLAGALASYMESCARSSPTGPDNSGQQPASITLDLSQPANQALLNVGGTLALAANAVDSLGILLVRASSAEASAFSRKCTHQGCTIGAFNNGTSTCPCHGSKFNTSGGVVNGPATVSLRQYTTQLDNTILTVTA